MPLISIWIVPSPTGTGSASEPPCRTRSSSSVRSAARAARPTSSGRVFNSSSSSMTVSGTTTSLSPNEWTHAGSAISTDVSSTIRVRVCRGVGPVLRAGHSRAECGAGRPADQVLASRRAWSAWSRSVTATPHLHPSASPSGSVVRGTPTACCCTPRPPVGGGWWATGVGCTTSPEHHGVVSETCVFCDIVRGEVAADVVWRDDVAVAFLDRSPLFHGHTLVVPRRHVLTLPDLARRRGRVRSSNVSAWSPPRCRARSARKERSWPTTTS